jgi:hypothetical protein
VFNVGFWTANPASAFGNLNAWLLANTYFAAANTICLSCFKISTDLAPSVYLPYTANTFASRPDITGLRTRYSTLLNTRNIIVSMQLRGVNMVFIDNEYRPGLSPDVSQGSSYAIYSDRMYLIVVIVAPNGTPRISITT